MMPCSRAASLHASPSYQTAMEDLDKLLQDTESSVERILSRYTASTGKSSEVEVLDVRTSLSMGIKPTICTNGQEAHTNTLYNNDVSVSQLGPTQTHASARQSVHSHGVQNWFSQKQSDLTGHEKSSLGMDAFASNCKGASSNDDDLRLFLEEIKKTICNWSYRKRALLQDRPSAERDEAPGNSGLCSSNGVSSLLGSKRGQNHFMSMPSLEGTKPRENVVEVHQNQEEEEMRFGAVHQKQSDAGKRGGLVLHHSQKEEETGGGRTLQQAKDPGHFISETDMENLDRSEEIVDGIASQLQSNEQTTTAHSHDMPERENSAYLSLEKRNTQVLPLSTEGSGATKATNTDSIPSMKENAAAIENSLTTTNTEQTEVKLPLTKWTPAKSAVKASEKSLSFPRPVEVITSPDWLPEGWVTEVKTRGSGNSAGSKDKYYVDPVSHRRFRSRKEVIAYLERGKPKSNDSPETSPVKKFLVPDVSPSLPNKSTKKAKHKESVAPSSSALPPSLTPSIASPGLLGNMFMPPFRTGQPSEWLVYESLASLPFPMFDPFYYAELGVNKSSSGKGSHVPTRPWFFSGPEASWSPFMDRSSLGKSGDKVRDYQNYYSVPSYPSDAVSKPSGDVVKKSSKRKPTDS